MSVRILALILFAVRLTPAQVTPLIDAVHKGHAVGHEQDGVNAIRDALAAGGDVNERDKSGWTPLMHAALECRADEMKLLLDKGGDPKLRGNIVVVRGSRHGTPFDSVRITNACLRAFLRDGALPGESSWLCDSEMHAKSLTLAGSIAEEHALSSLLLD